MEPTRTETHIEIYDNVRQMQQGIKQMEAQGWSVVGVERVDQGWGCLKTGCLGALFLPLALLGKKPQKHQVTFRREMVLRLHRIDPPTA
jgi:hypothetical protein